MAATCGPSIVVSIFVAIALFHHTSCYPQNPPIEPYSTPNIENVTTNPNETTFTISPAELLLTVNETSGLESETSIDNTTGQDVTPGQSGNVSSVLSDFDCWNVGTGNYGNPNVTCDTKFFVCVDREMFAYQLRCPAKLYFDPETKQCDMWAHIPACSGKPRPSTPATNEAEVTLSPVPIVIDCHDKPDGNYPDPVSTPKANCSNRYFTCIGKRQMVSSCPRGLYFDHERNECDLYDRVFTCSGNRVADETVAVQSTFAPVNFSCDGRPDGFYVEKCDNIFYSCTVGQVFQFECPSDLVFDTEWLSCESPANTFICTGTRRPATAPHSSTAHGIPASTTPSPMNCKGIPDGTYRDPSANCSRIFYHCAHETTIRNVCPGNLYFDDSFKRCDLWINVFDCSGVHPTVSIKPTTVATSPIPAVDYDCAKLEDGNYVNPKNNCSQFYYVCANMEGFQQDCPAGLFYDPDLNTCDQWASIPACSGVNRKPTEASFLNFTTEIPEFDCSQRSDGAYVPESKNCSGTYFRCLGGTAIKLVCPDGLFYDATVDQCDLSDNVFTCSGRTRPPAPPSTPATSPGPTVKPRIDCTLLVDGDYVDPSAKNECSQNFYTCSGGEAVERRCPGRTYYDGELKLCSSYWNVPACTGQPRENTTSPPRPVSPGSPLPFDCTKLYDGNYPAGNCSRNYWSCVGGLTFAHQCPIGSVYDEEFNDCEFPFMLPNCGGNRTVERATKFVATGTPAGGFDCKFRQEGNYVDPAASDGCSRIYYTCANGITSRSDCPSGLYFDVVAQQCNSRDNVPACGGIRANVTQPELQSTTLPSVNASLESTDLTSESTVPGSTVIESSTAPIGINGTETSTVESFSNIVNLDNTTMSVTAETGSPSPAFQLINETVPSAEATSASIQIESTTMVSSENASEIVTIQENVGGLTESGTSALPTEILNVSEAGTSALPTEILNISQAGLENATITQQSSSTESATGTGELVNPNEISIVTAVSLENVTNVPSNESGSGNVSEAGLLSTASASDLSSTSSPLPTELLQSTSEYHVNTSSNVSAADLSNVTSAIPIDEGFTDLTHSPSPAEVVNTTGGNVPVGVESSSAVFIHEQFSTSSPASELRENANVSIATGSEITNASFTFTEPTSTTASTSTAENVTVAALEISTAAETGATGLVNATEVSLDNGTRVISHESGAGTILLSTENVGEVNSTLVPLPAEILQSTSEQPVNASSNVSAADLLNATSAVPINEGSTDLTLSPSPAELLNKTSGNISAIRESSTAMFMNESFLTSSPSPDNVTVAALENSNITTETDTSGQVNATEVSLENGTRVISNVSGSEASFTCGGLGDGNYPAGACTEHYWACVDGIAMDRQCPIGTVFDDESDNCEPMSTVPTCDGIRDATSAGSSELSGNVSVINTTQSENVSASTSVNETSAVSAPSPASVLESSSSPNVTVAQQEFSNVSQSGLENATGAEPVSPIDQSSQNVNNSDGLVYTTGISKISQASLENATRAASNESGSASFDCTGLRDGNYPAGNCTESYWACVGGISYSRQCPVGTVFDDDVDNCEPISLVRTCGGVRIGGSTENAAVLSDLSSNQGASTGNTNASSMTNETSAASLDESSSAGNVISNISVATGSELINTTEITSVSQASLENTTQTNVSTTVPAELTVSTVQVSPAEVISVSSTISDVSSSLVPGSNVEQSSGVIGNSDTLSAGTENTTAAGRHNINF